MTVDDRRARRFDPIVTVGFDYSVTLTFTDAAAPVTPGAAVGTVTVPGGTDIEMTAATLSNAVTFTLAAADTVTLGRGSWSYLISCELEGSTVPVLTGTLKIAAAGDGRPGSINEAFTIEVAGDTNVAVDVVASTGSSGGGGLATTGTITANDFAQFTNSSTVRGRDAAEVRGDLSVYSSAQVDSAIDTDVATHAALTTSVHGIADTAALETTTGAQAKATAAQAAAEATAGAALSAHEAAADPHPGYLTPAEGNAAYQPLSAVLSATTASFTTADETKLDGIAAGATTDATVTAHIADTDDAHDASAISVLDTAALYTATNVEAALAEVKQIADAAAGGGISPTGTIAANDIPRFTDGSTVEGLSYSELRAALDLEVGTDVAAQSHVGSGGGAHANAVASGAAGFMTGADKAKLDGIEALADVTDATNVAAAGAVMEADTSTASMSFVVDEDNMVSNSATKLPTQQSTKAYVDTTVAALSGTYAPKATFPVEFIVALSDMTTQITTGTAKAYFHAPYAFTLTGVKATLATAGSGSTIVDVNEGAGAGTSVLSTKITIEASETTSLDATTQPVISDSSIAADARLTFDIDTAGTSAAGLQVTLLGTRVLA